MFFLGLNSIVLSCSYFTWLLLIPLFFPNQFQGSVTEYECSPEEFWQLQVEFWSKFYACCLQYQEALSRPLALHLNPYTSMVCLLKKVSLGGGEIP